MGRSRHLLLALAAGTLLTACGADSPSAAPPSAPAAASPTAATPSQTPDLSARLAQDAREAFETATAAHPGADLDQCTRDTPLDDEDCGAALTAASQVAADTARRLREESPEYAELFYGNVFVTIGEFQGSLRQLRDPIPCYGLSDASEPPPPLRAEAESICAEAADIAKVIWRIFVDQVGG
jgi:hypothetical protein